MENYMTEEGLKKMQDELEALETDGRKRSSEELQLAISHGDLKENAAYDTAKNNQAFLEGKIAKLKEIIRTAKIVKKQQGSKVQIGAKVTVFANNEEDTYEIVGIGESNPSEGKISYDAPIAKALLDHIAGDEIKVEYPNETVKYKILRID